MDKLLIVEDEKLIRQGIKVMISRSGVKVKEILECSNGMDALAILKNEKIDVMFTDIRMPQMDGIELVKKSAELEHRPMTVVVSGYDDFSYAVEMLRTGVKEYMLKPVEREAVKTILVKLEEELIREKEREEENQQIGISQLKYMILNEAVSKDEMQASAGRFEAFLLGEEYRILCTFREQEGFNEQAGSLYLGDIDGNTIYLLRKEAVEGVEENQKTGFEGDELFAGVSSSHYKMQELKQAYEEAQAARKFAFCRRKKWVQFEEGISFYADAVREENTDDAMQNLAQLLGTDRFEQLLKRLEQMTGAAKMPKGNPFVFENSISSLTNAVLDIYSSLHTEEREEGGRLLNIYSFSDIESFMEAYTGFMIEIHERMDQEFGDYRNKQKMKQALIYIGENYDKDLNMAVVSNFVSMNYSLFSYEFKEYTGKNFITYLKELRLKEAKCLLSETDLKVLEIGQRIGYENEKHFMKVFKSEYGVTPSEYRKNMQRH